MNLIDNSYELDRHDFEKVQGHKGHVLWFTGLSGSGKSTLCSQLANALFAANIRFIVLDGDHIRQGLNKDCDFSENGRNENLRRIAELARFLLKQGHVVLCSFISPTDTQREMAYQIIGEGDFSLIYVKASLATCEERDPKGLYSRVRLGQIENFTGISSLFEDPKKVGLVLNTEKFSINHCSHELVQFCLEKIGQDLEFV